MGVRYGRTAVAWGLLGRGAGIDESPLIGETAVIGRGGTTSRDGGVGGGVTDDNDGHKNATR